LRQTLLLIPHELFGVPLFGVGWALLAWAIFSVVLIAWLARRQGWTSETLSYLPVLLVVGAAICFVLPMIEERNSEGQLIGLPIRGYGVMMLLGVISGVALAVYRARRMGIDPEVILSLTFWMFLAGITGARVFYVVQNWSEFAKIQKGGSIDWGATLGATLNVTQGGLVVYGSVIGGVAAALIFLRRRNLPVLAIGDLIAPSMLLGLALGRIGCFLNGCCFGGVCEAPQQFSYLAVSFPRTNPPGEMETPPYMHQHVWGLLHGIRLGKDAAGKPIVAHVDPGSPAEKAGVKSGDQIAKINGFPAESLRDANTGLGAASSFIQIETADGRKLSWSIDGLPPYSRSVHPTQIYAAINAALLCFFLWVYYPYRRRDGEVFALMLILYPVTRILLEIIRDDVPGMFDLLGHPVTISQFISALIFVAAIGLWGYLTRQTSGSILPIQAA
jgi:phosphatidylglycerol:prolipoprotein diacylglycerol transferase